ncbi:MAG: rRNA maturation RNase YbeY [Myxococcota bacterium]|nr:rRNA maturation RNase YbeY [Myxococcota bacterium]
MSGPTVLAREEGSATLPVDLVGDAEALMVAARLDDCELSLVACDDAFIRPLNASWRGKDAATDVLSFPQDDPVVLGDLVISLETAARQATERNHSLQAELRILLVHGLLHLLGYDHENDEAEMLEMVDAETRLMERLGWEGRGLIERVQGAAQAD